MKKKWNEKTKKTAVIASLIAVGVIAIAGISLCIYKDAPQKAEIAEAEVSEDMVEIPENGLTVPDTEDTKAQEAEQVVVSTEISKETETEDTHVQSIQPTQVKTEDQKPAEASTETDKKTGDDQGNKPQDTVKQEPQQPQTEQPPENSDSPQHGEIRGDKMYVDGFGWIDYNGGGTVVIPADDIYENGNKIGIMD
jgi:hypothetical protein